MMPTSTAHFDRFHWIKQVEKEFLASRFGLSQLEQARRRNLITLVRAGCSDGDIVKAMTNLEGTYVLRVFAEFEAALRTIYQRIRKRKAQPRANVSLLITWLARNFMPEKVHADAHRVREYRNSLAHEGGAAASIGLSECRSILCKYLSFMPRMP